MAKQEVSAGGVVYKKNGENVEFLISKHSGYHKWVLPKGLVEAGETFEQAAVREVSEETGVKARIVVPLGNPEQYVYTLNGEKIFKTVHYFLMEYVEDLPAGHDFEMEDVRWVSFDESKEMLGFEGAKQTVLHAYQLLQKKEQS